jgi:hypothetical protein
VVIIGGTIVAGVLGGLRLAGLIGILLFIILDGLSCIWTILTHSTAEKIHEELEARERDRFAEKTIDTCIRNVLFEA